jgi:hypothetical protein
MTVLTTGDAGARHGYLKRARPGWRRSMWSVRNEGGPWECGAGHASLLSYRCSICGMPLGDE